MSRPVSNSAGDAVWLSPKGEALADREVNHRENPVDRSGKSTASPLPQQRRTPPPAPYTQTPPPAARSTQRTPIGAPLAPATRPPVSPGTLGSPTAPGATAKPFRDHHAYSFDNASDVGSNSSICAPSGFLRDRSPSLPTGSLPSTARDAKDEVMAATKYYFDMQTLEWKETPIRLRVRHPNRGLGQDDLFVFFAVEILEDEHMIKMINDDASRHNYQVTHSFRNDGPNMYQDLNASSNGNGFDASLNESKKLPRPIPFLARLYRHGISDVCEDDYFGLSQSQAMCEELCRHYNQTKLFQATRKNLDKLTVRPLPLMTGRFLIRIPANEIPSNAVAAKKGFFSYRTQDTRELFAFVEPDVVLCDLMNIQIAPSMEEFFQMNLNNDDHSEDDALAGTGTESWLSGSKFFICQYPRAEPTWRKPEYSQLAEAFSHYTHSCTQHEIVICGLRRGSGFLTDPLVHSRDKKQFGMGNGGLKEITKWSVRHTCNETCAFMHLPPPRGSGAESSTNQFDSLQMASSTYYVDMAQLLCQSMPYTFLSKKPSLEREPPSVSPPPPEKLQLVASPKPEDIGSKTPSVVSGWQSPVMNSPRPKTVKMVKKEPPGAQARAPAKTEPVKGTVVVTAAPAAAVSATPAAAPAPARSPAQTEPIKGTVLSTPTTVSIPVHKAQPVKSSPAPPVKLTINSKASPLPTKKLELDKTSPPPPLKIDPAEDACPDSPTPVFTVISTTAAVPITTQTPTAATNNTSISFTPVDTPRSQAFTPPASAPLPAVLTFPHRRHNVKSSRSTGETPVNSARTDDARSVALAHSTGSRGTGALRSRHSSDGSNAASSTKAADKVPKRPKSTTAPNGRPSSGSTSSNQPPKRAPTPRRLSGSGSGPPAPEPFHATMSGSGYLKTNERPPVRRRRKPVEVPKTRADTPARAPSTSAVEVEAATPMPKMTSPPQRHPPMRRAPAPSGAGAPAAFMRCATENSTLSRSRNRDDSFSLRARDDGFDTSVVEEPKLFDMKNVFPATKYVFDLKTLLWRGRRTFVRVCNPDCGVAQGGMRVCFDVNEVDPADPHSEEILNVAKMYRRTISKVVEEDYFNEGEVQHLCAEIVKQFNQAPYTGTMTARHRIELQMMGCSVVMFNHDDIPEHLYQSRKGFFSYRTTDSHRVLFTMEPKLIGNFTKYNGNFGESYATNERPLPVELRWRRLQVFEAAEALSHFSLTQSDGGLLLCDVQGVEDRLTDPEVHTYNREGMGIGNMGQEGINRFMEKHRCTKVCRCLGLEPFSEESGKPQLSEQSKQTNYLVRLANRLNDRNRPNRIIEPPVKGK